MNSVFRFVSGWSSGSWTRPKLESSGGYCGKHIKTCRTKRKNSCMSPMMHRILKILFTTPPPPPNLSLPLSLCSPSLPPSLSLSLSLCFSLPPSLPSLLPYLSFTHSLRLSSSILIELLRTYSEADAKDATQLAEKLIALIISDPKQFVFDNLLQLAPVAALEGRKSLQVSGLMIRKLDPKIFLRPLTSLLSCIP